MVLEAPWGSCQAKPSWDPLIIGLEICTHVLARLQLAGSFLVGLVTARVIVGVLIWTYQASLSQRGTFASPVSTVSERSTSRQEAAKLRVPELSGNVLWLLKANLTSSLVILSPAEMTKRDGGLERECQHSLEVEVEGCWKPLRPPCEGHGV